MRTSNLISRGFLPFFICSTISLKYQDCVCCHKKSLQFLSTMSYGLKMVSPVTWYWHHLSIWFTHQILELVRPLPLKTSEISNHGISSSFLFFSFLFNIWDEMWCGKSVDVLSFAQWLGVSVILHSEGKRNLGCDSTVFPWYIIKWMCKKSTLRNSKCSSYLSILSSSWNANCLCTFLFHCVFAGQHTRSFDQYLQLVPQDCYMYLLPC